MKKTITLVTISLLCLCFAIRTSEAQWRIQKDMREGIAEEGLSSENENYVIANSLKLILDDVEVTLNCDNIALDETREEGSVIVDLSECTSFQSDPPIDDSEYQTVNGNGENCSCNGDISECWDGAPGVPFTIDCSTQSCCYTDDSGVYSTSCVCDQQTPSVTFGKCVPPEDYQVCTPEEKDNGDCDEVNVATCEDPAVCVQETGKCYNIPDAIVDISRMLSLFGGGGSLTGPDWKFPSDMSDD